MTYHDEGPQGRSATGTSLDYRTYWEKARPFGTYLEREVREHEELWRGVWKKARVSERMLERAGSLEEEWKLLVLSEDWCGDASNTVPVLARFAGTVPGVEMRVLKRDENPEVMDRFLTNGSRSIPLAILLDGDFEVRGRWGPRPAELQAFVLSEKRAGERSVDEIYKETRRWYARDRGESTLRELLETLEAAEAERG